MVIFKITPHIFSDVVSELNMKDFVVAYGMTETSPVTFQVRKDFDSKFYFPTSVSGFLR